MSNPVKDGATGGRTLCTYTSSNGNCGLTAGHMGIHDSGPAPLPSLDERVQDAERERVRQIEADRAAVAKMYPAPLPVAEFKGRMLAACGCEVVGKDSAGNPLPACGVQGFRYYGGHCESEIKVCGLPEHSGTGWHRCDVRPAGGKP